MCGNWYHRKHSAHVNVLHYISNFKCNCSSFVYQKVFNSLLLTSKTQKCVLAEYFAQTCIYYLLKSVSSRFVVTLSFTGNLQGTQEVT